MTKRGMAVPGFVFTSLLALGVTSAALTAADLSKYREFQLGTGLSVIAKQTGTSPAEAKTIHLRPALVQELEWRPQLLTLTSASKMDPAQTVVFSFYDGGLFQIAVNYDRYETEGLTTGDIVGAISVVYGTATTPPAAPAIAQGSFGDREEILARWQDPQYCFDLIRSSYGPTFRLVGIQKKLEAQAQAAILQATRLDDQEAPQRNAARLAREEEAVKANLEKARLVNKPKFRP